MNKMQRVDELHCGENLPQDALNAGQCEIGLPSKLLMNTRNLIEVLFKQFSDNKQMLLISVRRVKRNEIAA